MVSTLVLGVSGLLPILFGDVNGAEEGATREEGEREEEGSWDPPLSAEDLTQLADVSFLFVS